MCDPTGAQNQTVLVILTDPVQRISVPQGTPWTGDPSVLVPPLSKEAGGAAGSVSSLTANGDGTYTHTSGADGATPTTIDVCADVAANCPPATLRDNGGGTYTWVRGDGTDDFTFTTGGGGSDVGEATVASNNNGTATITATDTAGTTTTANVITDLKRICDGSTLVPDTDEIVTKGQLVGLNRGHYVPFEASADGCTPLAPQCGVLPTFTIDPSGRLWSRPAGGTWSVLGEPEASSTDVTKPFIDPIGLQEVDVIGKNVQTTYYTATHCFTNPSTCRNAAIYPSVTVNRTGRWRQTSGAATGAVTSHYIKFNGSFLSSQTFDFRGMNAVGAPDGPPSQVDYAPNAGTGWTGVASIVPPGGEACFSIEVGYIFDNATPNGATAEHYLRGAYEFNWKWNLQ